MYRLLLDPFQGFIVVLCNNMPAVEVCVELLEAEAHWQTLNIYVASLHVCKSFTGKGNRLAAL